MRILLCGTVVGWCLYSFLEQKQQTVLIMPCTSSQIKTSKLLKLLVLQAVGTAQKASSEVWFGLRTKISGHGSDVDHASC